MSIKEKKEEGKRFLIFLAEIIACKKIGKETSKHPKAIKGLLYERVDALSIEMTEALIKAFPSEYKEFTNKSSE